MRVVIGTVLLAAALFMIACPQRAAAQQCETVGCPTAECWWVGPGQRRCRRVCQRRCWQEAPRYYSTEPQQSYSPPYQHSGIPPELLALCFAAVVVLLIIGGVSASTTNTLDHEIAELDHSTNVMHLEADATEEEIARIHADIADQERDGYEEGRAEADREWRKSRGRHD